LDSFRTESEVLYFLQVANIHWDVLRSKLKVMEPDKLTKSEIEEIVEESKKEKYSDTQLIGFGRGRTSIFRLSRETGLILIVGDEFTGYNHIIKRHSVTSRVPYWKDGKIGEPTKLPIEIAPIQYLNVAGQVFNPENKSVIKNNDPGIFDVYTGSVRYNQGYTFDLRLVTYKDTGIIHTMYPTTKRKEKVLRNLRHGFVSKASNNILRGIHTYEFAYFDEKNVERYKVILRSFEFQSLARWYIQANDSYGMPLLTTLLKETPFKSEMTVPSRMATIDFSDVSWIEKEIKKMMKGTFSF